MKLKNHMEQLVFCILGRVLEQEKCCKCEKCMLDIAALALNDLPPQYVVSEEKEVFLKAKQLEQQFEVDATAAIIKAAQIVGQNPRH